MTIAWQNSDQSSIITRIRNRFRYGLVIQEVLDRLSATFGLVVYPYYLVREQIQPNLKPVVAGNEDEFQVRYLTEDDMEIIVEHVARKRSAEALVRKLRSGARSIGFFVNGNLAAYTWFRLDRTPVPGWKKDLFRLEQDEAYLFDAYVFPAYRGRRLAPLVRYHAYEELQKIGRRRLYSITLAFNASSRRFKQRLLAKEVELRLLIGLKRWKTYDIRIRVFDDQLGTPLRQNLGRCMTKGESESS